MAVETSSEVGATWPEPASPPGRPLDGLRVLDLSRVLAGPFCTMILGDLGANVLKVESTRGDGTREWGPPFFGGTAAYYFSVNRNKRSVVLEFQTSAGQEALLDLIREADVVLHNFPALLAQKFGVDAETVASVNPRAVYCEISAFGDGAPERRGYDLIMQAYGGLMGVTGEPGRPAIKTGVAISDLAAGLFAAVGVLGMLLRRERGGTGGVVSVSLLDSVVGLLVNQAMNWLLCGVDPEPMGSEHPNVVPYGVFSAADGDIVIGVGSDVQFQRLCEALDTPDLAEDCRFITNAARSGNRDALRARLEAALASRSAAEWEAMFAVRGIPASKIRRISEVFDDPLVRNGTLSKVEDSVLGTIAQVLTPLVIDGERLQPYLTPPRLGQHTSVVVGADAADSQRAESNETVT